VALGIDFTLELSAIPDGATMLSAFVNEGLSTPTRGTVVFLSTEDIDGEAAIGQPAKLTLTFEDAPFRYFHFIVSGFTLDALVGEDRKRYVVDLVHELSLLSLRSDVRIFQEKDAKAIVTDVLTGAGLDAGAYSFSLRRTLPVRTYDVQYRETDFDYVSRLLEHEGVFYFANDTDGATAVTIADDPGVFTPIDGDPALAILDDDEHGDGVSDLVIEDRVAPKTATVCDYNFETPGVNLQSKREGGISTTGDFFEYAAGFQKPDEGDALAQIRMEEIVAAQQTVSGRTERRALRAGATFDLEGADRDALNTTYLLTSVRHRVVLRDETGSTGRVAYENRFTAIPADRPYRPVRRAPKPKLNGLHSAVVTGPGGEIHTDELGRMKGKFFWDRVGKADDKASTWMRVNQLPISGSMALARMTWEMSIAYFDGDLSRPLAVNRLYNAEKTSPYGYPAAKTRMSFQTPSTPGGGNSNELRMEDGGGGMEMYIHASKAYESKTINNKTETVDVDEKINVGTDADVTVGANQTVSIGASLSATVSANAGNKVTGDRTKSVGASETVSVSGNIGAVVKGSDTETVGGSQTTLAALGVDKTSKGSYSLTVGGSLIQAAGMGVTFMLAGAKSETVGGVKIAASGAGVTESIIGAYAATVGGAIVQAAGANRMGATKGAAAVTVGGLVNVNAGGKVSITAKKVAIRVLGVANFLGGGGILNMTPGSVAFVGLVTLDASGSIKISGNPNLVG